MNTKTKREQRRKKQQKQELTSKLIWGGIAIAVATIIGLVVWQGVKPAAGEAIPEMVEVPHIPTDTDPGQYNSDPPTSGHLMRMNWMLDFMRIIVINIPQAILFTSLSTVT